MRLIDADALKEVIYNNLYTITDFFNRQDRGMFWTGGIEKAIDEAPTMDAESVRCGEWKHIEEYKGAGFGFLKCSVCGNPLWFTTKYCPNCGARLNEVEE